MGGQNKRNESGRQREKERNLIEYFFFLVTNLKIYSLKKTI